MIRRIQSICTMHTDSCEATSMGTCSPHIGHNAVQHTWSSQHALPAVCSTTAVQISKPSWSVQGCDHPHPARKHFSTAVRHPHIFCKRHPHTPATTTTPTTLVHAHYSRQPPCLAQASPPLPVATPLPAPSVGATMHLPQTRSPATANTLH